MASVTKGIEDIRSLSTDAVTKDNFKYIVGIDYADGYQAVVCQPMMSSVAFQVVLFSAPSDADLSGLAAKMKENADPRKWVCVTADTVDTAVNGNVVLFYMVDSASYPKTVPAITANFAALSV